MNLNLIDKFVVRLNALSIPYVKRSNNELFFEVDIDSLNYFIFANIEQKGNVFKLNIQRDILSTHFCKKKTYLLNIFCKIVLLNMSARFGENLNLEFNKNTGSLSLCLMIKSYQIDDNLLSLKGICESLLSNLALLHIYYYRFSPLLSSDHPTMNDYYDEKIIKSLVLQDPINA